MSIQMFFPSPSQHSVCELLCLSCKVWGIAGSFCNSDLGEYRIQILWRTMSSSQAMGVLRHCYSSPTFCIYIPAHVFRRYFISNILFLTHLSPACFYLPALGLKVYITTCQAFLGVWGMFLHNNTNVGTSFLLSFSLVGNSLLFSHSPFICQVGLFGQHLLVSEL